MAQKMLTMAEKKEQRRKEKERKIKALNAALNKSLQRDGIVSAPPPPARRSSRSVPAPPEAPPQPPSEAAIATDIRIRSVGRFAQKYKTPEEMAPIIREFFDYCINQNKPPLVTTLALALGFSSKSSIDDYKQKPEFCDMITRAKLVCEDFAAQGLISGKNTVGFIFLLKQYGWRDIQESVVTYETHEQRIARLIKSNSAGGKP